VIEGVFTDQQKQEMIRRITDAMVEIEGESLRSVTWVLVEGSFCTVQTVGVQQTAAAVHRACVVLASWVAG
jgi:Tautomerase enzyme